MPAQSAPVLVLRFGAEGRAAQCCSGVLLHSSRVESCQALIMNQESLRCSTLLLLTHDDRPADRITRE